MSFTPTVLTGANIYFDAADLTGFSNKIEFGATANKLTRTTFGDGGSNTYVGGLFDGKANIDGFFQAGDLSMPDDSFWANLSTPNAPLSVMPSSSGAAGDLVYLTRGLVCSYQPGGKVGDLLSFASEINTNWPDVRGKILHPQGAARTVTGNGTGIQLGAVNVSHALYICLHVLSYVDGSLTVAVQSSVDNTFGSPTTQGTFAAATALGGQTLKIVGGITDQWWRVNWTISGGSTHSFLFAVSAGIGPK